MKSSKLSYIYEYPKFLRKIRNLNDIIFFFPFYHFGGGETVHLDILKMFKDYNTSCFIVHKSDNEFLREEFNNASLVIDLWKFKSSKYRSYLKSLAKVINSKNNAIVFGCNNRFFYNLLEYLDDEKVRIIDLTHAFSYEDPLSVEKFSLPWVNKIHKRIILGTKTLEDYTQLYQNNGIDAHLLKRFVIIKNGVDVPAKMIEKPINKSLKVLFVARNSPEKRPEIFFEIAKKCYEKKINASFKVIGDFEDIEETSPNLQIVGSIQDRERLNRYYLDSDVLLITSFREGFPMVILEGMAHGVVPISTNVGEISSFINLDNKNGILIDDNTLTKYTDLNQKSNTCIIVSEITHLHLEYPEIQKLISNFVQAIKDLAQNRTLLNVISVNAYKTVKKDFSKNSNIKSYYEVFFSR